MRRHVIVLAAAALALAGLACQGGGNGQPDDPTEPEATQSSEPGYVEDPCYKQDPDAALGAPATDSCATESASDESS